MKNTTYTVLVTIAHDDGQAPDWETLSRHIQQGLEEGTREHNGHASATVDAFQGDRLDEPSQNFTLSRSGLPAKCFHAHLRLLRETA